MSGEDKLFAETRARNEAFTFGKDTAAVFDDMLDRSVPFYSEIQRMLGELSAYFAVDGTSVYDLGCSTANTFLAVGAFLRPEFPGSHWGCRPNRSGGPSGRVRPVQERSWSISQRGAARGSGRWNSGPSCFRRSPVFAPPGFCSAPLQTMRPRRSGWRRR